MNSFSNIFKHCVVTLIMGHVKKYCILLLLLFFAGEVVAQNVVVKSPVLFLALGDSYTIGQGVDEKDRWPVQLEKELEKRGVEINTSNIIARTGWTTRDLINAIRSEAPDSTFNLVSLLIGVNNQYQGVSIDVYPNEFRSLLETALALCGGRREGVFVLSIPDYGYTPFGLWNQKTISAEIDRYNQINKQITNEMGIAYFDITPISREVVSKTSYLASDNLHPSGTMYERWVKLIAKRIDIDVISSNTSVSAKQNGVQVYPNPTRDQLVVVVPEYDCKLEIFDVRGVSVWSRDEMKSLDLRIGTRKWRSGIYSYRVTLSNGEVFRGKFIKE